jgi:hypothetical protein
LDWGFLFFVGILLFARLGNYSLWDDESMVALASQGILASGDTTSMHGENIAAYRSGLLLRNLCDRSTPPFTAYLIAPSIWLFGGTSFAARFPCAMLGLAFMLLVVGLMRKIKASNLECLIGYLAVIGNVSLFLFLRQSRYFAPTILLSTLIILCYLSWSEAKRKNLIWAILLFSVLFATNYMACLALFLTLAVDYVIWKRKITTFPLRDIWPWMLGSSFFCLLISIVWNPYKTGFGLYTLKNTLGERIILYFWNWRDTADCQFWILGLLLAGLVLAVLKRDPWLQRGWVALILFTAVITAVSPQLVAGASVADVRYLAPLMPLGIALSVRTFLLLFGSRPLVTFFVGLLLFWTNLVSGAFFGGRPFRSPLWEFIHELAVPPSEPYSVAVQWIAKHISPKSTVWVLPDYACYPLMFHSPNVTYAWQLRKEQKKEEQFKNLPDINFQGLVPPDFILVFGPSVQEIRQIVGQWSMEGLRYQEVSRLMTFWKDLYRPELFWRTFKPIENFDPNIEAIYIFKRQS